MTKFATIAIMLAIAVMLAIAAPAFAQDDWEAQQQSDIAHSEQQQYEMQQNFLLQQQQDQLYQMQQRQPGGPTPDQEQFNRDFPALLPTPQ